MRQWLRFAVIIEGDKRGMAETKYDKIYRDLKEKIEGDRYPYLSYLPSEYSLIEEYDCSRNTARRAIGQLAKEGYVQSIHGKGVQVIFEPAVEESSFLFGGSESMREAASRNLKKLRTKVVFFCELTVDERIAKRTSFPVGIPIYYVQRVRYIDGQALIIDHNYFDKRVVGELNKGIMEASVYQHLEKEVGMRIMTTKRKMTVEKITQIDEKYLELGDYNCMAVVSSSTYDDQGNMFEYTESRHRPDKFVFYSIAHRKG